MFSQTLLTADRGYSAETNLLTASGGAVPALLTKPFVAKKKTLCHQSVPQQLGLFYSPTLSRTFATSLSSRYAPHLPNGPVSSSSHLSSSSPSRAQVRLSSLSSASPFLNTLSSEMRFTWDWDCPSLNETLIAGCASYQAFSRYLSGSDLFILPRTRTELESIL